jgi:para-nitrobenzyl esterase
MKLTRREFTAGTGLVLSAVLTPACADSGKEPVVETSYGKIRGAVHDGVYSFKGVPYGASTAGANRYMPPRPPQPWKGVKDCLEWGPMAPQPKSTSLNPSSGMGKDFATFFGTQPDAPSAQSEDCLCLNVFTPGLDDAKRAVMVWIHGGGFGIGAGGGARANGTHLAQRQDVVAISLHHRLGALGYCHLGEFDPAFEHSGNVGQLDLIAALQWIRDNVAAFGGDPNRIMIHGESGGGGKIGTLLGMPKASGLFQRAILQSGTANRLPARSRAAELAGELLAALQIPTNQVRRIQDIPADAIIAAASKLETPGAGPRRGFVPTVGTVDLPQNPLDAVANGSARIPIMLGCTKHEMALMLAGAGTDPRTVTAEQLQGRVKAMMGDRSQALLDGYRTNHPDYTPGDLLVRILSDGMRMGAIELAEAHVKAGGAPTYMYLFTWESPALPYLKAAHGIDGTFYFDNTESVGIAQGNPDAVALAKRASTAWANFAKEGKPSASGLPAWPQYTLDKRETMILSTQPHIESDPMKEDRLLRAKLGAPTGF